MSNTILEQFEADQLAKVSPNKNIPDFRPGDTVRVDVRIVEGTTERVQAFEGLCIARRNRGMNSSFTVRKISNGEGVERVFPLYSPLVGNIHLVRRGVVRRSKLYYMRDLTGKAARITEKRDVVSTGASNELKKEKKKAKAEKKTAKSDNAESKN